jgi:uncharacterized protein YndB with AHSA1/START domain
VYVVDLPATRLYQRGLVVDLATQRRAPNGEWGTPKQFSLREDQWADAPDAVDRQIVIMRLLDAPREQVFEVWTTPEHVANWWGPDGFTITTGSMEVRPGGEWRFTMHGPDGADYPNLIRYTDVVPPERLSYAHMDMPAADDTTFDVDVFFDEFLGNTVLTMKMVFPTAAALAENVAKYHSIEGGNQTADRLVAYVLKARHDTSTVA